jgi:hypothetical protein
MQINIGRYKAINVTDFCRCLAAFQLKKKVARLVIGSALCSKMSSLSFECISNF